MNLELETPKDSFTVGINDDVNHTSIPIPDEMIVATPKV